MCFAVLALFFTRTIEITSRAQIVARVDSKSLNRRRRTIVQNGCRLGAA